MHVNSIQSFNFNNSIMARRAQEPAPQPQEPTQEPAKSIYFGNGDKSGKSMRNATMAVLVPLALLTGGSAVTTSCEKDDVYAEAKAEAKAEAYAYCCRCGGYHGQGGCPCGNDTTKNDTTNNDTTKNDWYKPLPLDTLAKHMYIWDIDNFNDTTANAKRNIIHYHYARPWEYNNEVDARMNMAESKQDKSILVHDTEVFDYKGNHLYYGKEVREVPKNPVTLKTFSGKTIKTNALMTLELRRNNNDAKGAALKNTTVDEKLALMTVGDTVIVFKMDKNGIYQQDGKMAKGYLDDNTILLQDLIGEYPTDDHLTNFKLTAVTDEELKALMAETK